MHRFRFEPWVGNGYRSGRRWGKRLLIPGESHYAGESQPPTFTRDLTQDYVRGQHSHPFWTRVAQVVEGKRADQIDRKAFWNSVAFYNYIQEIVARGPRRAPSPAAWARAEQPFNAVLRRLRSDAVLVLGVRLWNQLPDTGDNERGFSVNRLVRDVYSFPTARGHRAFATNINHPSSFGFSWRKWHPVATRLIVL